MILSAIYFLIICFLVSKLSFFKDNELSLKFIVFILIIKCLGCFAYYWIYFKYYPGNFQSDSSSTMADAKIIYDALPNHVADFIKMVLGLHSNSDADPLYDVYFKYIGKWGKDDVSSQFFLNDNRTSIRINAVIMLFSFGYYPVHALVMLLLSFIGQFAFYKTFKNYFPKKEIILALIIFITPSILFWTSGVLKEPIVLCLLGLFIYTYFKIFITKEFKIKYVLVLLITTLFFLILKPYILILLIVPLIAFTLVKKYEVKNVGSFYIVFLLAVYGICILFLKFVINKDVINTIVIRQNDFVSLSKGGIFFANDKNYLRLEYKDSTFYKVVDDEKNLCKIEPHAQLMYWNIHHLRDTIYVSDNKDSATYTLLSVCAPAGSSIDVDRLEYSFNSFIKIIPKALFNTLCKPFFYDSHSLMELLASFENLFILCFIIVCFLHRIKIPIDKNIFFLFLSLIILASFLIGITTTVMGAIVRYKVPFIPFMLMIPLLFLDSNLTKKIPLIKHLVN